MIYPKQKKILKAASGLDTDKINAIDNAIISGTSFIPGVGTAISAGLSIGQKLGESISGDGTKAGKNIAGDLLNPLSTVNNLLSGNFKEAIPILGSINKAKRLSKEQETLDRLRMSQEANSLTEAGNKKFSTLTYETGGKLTGTDNNDSDDANILGGRSHDDGGNEIIDGDNGEKLAESEDQEIIFSKKQTDFIDNNISLYNKTGESSYLIDLGKYVADVVNNKTNDHSKKVL